MDEDYRLGGFANENKEANRGVEDEISAYLLSVPVHLLAVIHAPKSIFVVINQLFSTFFWCSVEGKAKGKRVKLDLLSKPVDKGDVGLGSLINV